MATPSTAILTIVRNEHPFILEWLEYHVHLGFDRVYLVSTDEDHESLAKLIESSTFSPYVKLFHYNKFDHGWQIRCYNTFFSEIKESWVMTLDADEYVYLNDYKNIHSALSSLISSHDGEPAQIQFPWLNLTTSRYLHSATFDILNQPIANTSNHVKSIAKRDQIKRVGIHAHFTDGAENCLSSGEPTQEQNRNELFIQEPTYYHAHPCILHFTTRGHFDVMTRIIDHQFFNTKSGEAERARLKSFLLNDPSWQNLPNRFLLMKIHESLPKVELGLKLPKLHTQTDQQTMIELFSSNFKKIVSYDFPELVNLESSFEDAFQLQAKLESLTLPECNIDTYLGCSSQLEYAGKLRQQLALIDS